MKFLDLDGPPRSFNQIWNEMMTEIEEFGFLGDAETPVELEKHPQTHIRHALNHLHINGECVKSRYGFCTA